MTRNSDGLQPRCKDCNRAYRLQNVERARQYRLITGERSRRLDRERYAQNRESELTRSALYRSQNREQVRRVGRESAARNADRRREYMRQRRMANPTAKRDYRLRNLERIRIQDQSYNRSEAGRQAARAAKARRRARKLALPTRPWRTAEILARGVALRGVASCWLCRAALAADSTIHFDHLIPLAADEAALDVFGVVNPGDVPENVDTACPRCNLRKRNEVLPCAVARYFLNLQYEARGAEMSLQDGDFAGLDTPQPGDPGWDIDQWDAQITEPLPVVVQP
ncbi:hypothetical protein [Pseudonocardia sp. 73-21]|uniref:HNH endonuclease n=1 Tax=Pseudonocardia sp. 73-21 TaxID=1895809 RepID=UPI0009688B86|nr:hypothetical protein [Pseudonocardia sp. 73-21]OJY47639.1 MAG: hypothetical protein BGP03_33445 [Pseudonocardia sp. 73-21]